MRVEYRTDLLNVVRAALFSFSSGVGRFSEKIQELKASAVANIANIFAFIIICQLKSYTNTTVNADIFCSQTKFAEAYQMLAEGNAERNHLDSRQGN